MSEFIKLDCLDNILNSIALKLIENKDLARCLKFTTSDALSKNIDEDGIVYLINQEGDITNTRVFFQPFNNQTLTDERSEIRVYHARFNPSNLYLSEIVVGFDIVVHNNIWRLDNGKRRPTTIFKLLLETLNGKDTGGIGKLLFIDEPCILRYYNSSFTGYSFFMKTRTG